MELWTHIEEFENYMVSSEGRIINDLTGREMIPSLNTTGVVQVGLTRGRRQYRRSVALIVAKAFLEEPRNEAFDTPIHLDGDRWNNKVDNLMWRPRWFAIRYFQQFFNHKRGFRVPVMEVESGEVFPTSWDAAIKYGLIDREIMHATMNRTYVWPTFQTFRVVK